jgi:hypothetical protein
VCSQMVPVFVWNRIEQLWGAKFTGSDLYLELGTAGLSCAVN